MFAGEATVPLTKNWEEGSGHRHKAHGVALRWGQQYAGSVILSVLLQMAQRGQKPVYS